MIRMALGILLVILTVATATAQKPVHHIDADQCEIIEFSVVEWPGDRYTWDIYRDSTVNFANAKGDVDPVPYFENGMYAGSTVRVLGLEPGRYFLRVMVWDETTCTNNLLVFSLEVHENKPEATIEGSEACYGEPVVFKIILTGNGPWDLTYTYGDGTATLNLNGVVEPEQTVILPALPAGTHDVWVKTIIDQCTENLVPSEKGRVVIFPKPVNSKIYPVEK